MKKTVLFTSLCLGLLFTSAHANFPNNDELNTNKVEISSLTEVSSFCKAILKGDLELVKKMIELGEDVNQKSLGMTPAMFAARYNKAEILEVLIDSGANLKAKSKEGFSAEKYAKMSNAIEALEVLESAK